MLVTSVWLSFDQPLYFSKASLLGAMIWTPCQHGGTASGRDWFIMRRKGQKQVRGAALQGLTAAAAKTLGAAGSGCIVNKGL
jgi:hypothetical protein